MIGNNSDWLMECGVNVSVTLCVLYAVTGNRRASAPTKAIILRVIPAKAEYTHRLYRAHVHTQFAQ